METLQNEIFWMPLFGSEITMRLIDADALLDAIDSWKCDITDYRDFLDIIADAPTVQREGWKQVGEVGEAIRERDRLGFAVVNVIGRLDEIIENTQEVEVDDFLHIAVPVDMWNELQAELEYMPKRADLYTSPQPSEWVGLSEGIKNNLIAEYEKHKNYYLLVSEVEAACKQINTKG